jgi:hypothetical protein
MARMKGTLKNTASFERWRSWTGGKHGQSRPAPDLPQGQDPRFQHDWLKTFASPGYSHYDWVDHSGRVHRISSAMILTYISIIPALGGVTLEFHGIWVEALGSSHPFWLSYTGDWYWGFSYQVLGLQRQSKVLHCIEINYLSQCWGCTLSNYGCRQFGYFGKVYHLSHIQSILMEMHTEIALKRTPHILVLLLQ